MHTHTETCVPIHTHAQMCRTFLAYMNVFCCPIKSGSLPAIGQPVYTVFLYSWVLLVPDLCEILLCRAFCLIQCSWESLIYILVYLHDSF